MIAFVIKSAICMVLFFGLYWLLLRKEKLFTFNRFYLILSVILSLTIPFISLPVNIGYEKAPLATTLLPDNIPAATPSMNEEDTAQPSKVTSENIHPDQANRSEAVKPIVIDVKKTLVFIYITGLTFMLIRFSRNILRVNRLLKKSEKIDHQWYRIALLDAKISPFSFLRTVFLNKLDYIEKRVGTSVLNHELEHVRQGHSFDIIFFEILHLLFWFNPALLLYKRAARINHEYLADEAVINGNTDIRSYANELITFISHRLTVPYASGFSPSMIRLRLFMLNRPVPKKSTSTFRISMTVISLVIMGFILCIEPTYSQPSESITVTGEDGSPQSVTKRSKIPDNQNIVIDEVLFRDLDFKPLKALIVLDGEKLGVDDIFSIDTRDIKTINILKNRKASRKYGKNAKDGVVEINTYANDKRYVPDSLYFKPLYTINDTIPENKLTIAVSNLNSLRTWTYPIFPNQDPVKRWRLLEIMTRDYYKIDGTVVQRNGEPLKGVKVSATYNPDETVTDEVGHFLLDDVRSGSLVTLSAEGYEPLTFKAIGRVFKTSSSIVLYRSDEPDPDMIISDAGNDIEDFSGTWKFNKDQSRTYVPEGYNMSYLIRQFDSDSLVLTSTSIMSGNERKNITTFVFNTAKRNVYLDSNISTIVRCTISHDGRSFTLTHKSRSLVRTPGGFTIDYKSADTFSLTVDGKQLIIREYNFRDASSEKGEEVQVRVFDKV